MASQVSGKEQELKLQKQAILLESPALKKTTTDARIEVTTKFIVLWTRDIFGLSLVNLFLLKFSKESSGSTTSLTVLIVVKVKGVIAGPITKWGTFNVRDKHLEGLNRKIA